MIDKNRVLEISHEQIKDVVSYDCLGEDDKEVTRWYMAARGILNMTDAILSELEDEDD